ncbi:hypothetical protein GA0070616_0067 [Micromonospora nigra]|uniref:Uncharacterized protein n=1 Tax=Micromonospora nigra TaxID=145857 RepID=A0A1C6R7D7_9ACTN|nr:hypothetical protein [Micromonospora nigra]SCL12927.1 hypothetical protein GA0070616_0067 [Micromonospora nigra]
MDSIADLSPADRDRYTRMDTLTITPYPTGPEYGCEPAARQVAEAVCRLYGGNAWRAEHKSPAWPHPENELHSELTITINNVRTIVHRHTVPAHTGRDLFALTVDGRAVPAHLPPHALPHQPATIVANLWRDLHQVAPTDCDSLGCPDVPTILTYGAALCPTHAQRYATTGHI